MPTAAHSAIRDPFKTIHFLAQIAQNIPLPSEGYRFPCFSFLKYRAGKADKQGPAGNTGSKAMMHVHTRPQKFIEGCTVLCAAPLPDTPDISWVLDHALLLCRTLELAGLRPQPDRYPLQEPSLKSSSHSSSHHHAVSRFSDLYWNHHQLSKKRTSLHFFSGF